MDSNPFKDKEKVKPTFEVVDIPTPEVLKAIKDLRIAVAQDSEEAFYLVTTPEKEEVMTDEERSKEFFGENKFVLLSRNGAELVGMNRAEEQDKGQWYVGSFCIKKEFRGRLGEQMFARLVKEIMDRKGTKITAAVKKKNNRTTNAALRMAGFKMIGANSPFPSGGFDMELDLTDPKIIEKVLKALNAG